MECVKTLKIKVVELVLSRDFFCVKMMECCELNLEKVKKVG